MNAKKKVLICTHTYPPESGGIAAFARDLFHLFKKMGYDVEIYNEKGRPVRKPWDVIVKFIFLLKAFWGTAAQKKHSIILSTKILPFGFVSILCKPFIKSKIILQVHGTEITGRYNSGWRKKLLCFLYNRADQVWANSKNTVKRLTSFGVSKEKIKLVYPFLTNDISDIPRIHKNKERSGYRIFTAATLYPRKGIDLVLRALSELKELEWKYIIAGKPRNGYQRFYENLAKELGIRSRIHFLGQV
jgi:glycosyltransferase involved in cell wall biosynthesis